MTAVGLPEILPADHPGRTDLIAIVKHLATGYTDQPYKPAAIRGHQGVLAKASVGPGAFLIMNEQPTHPANHSGREGVT
ncbi:hypothetical protein SK803_39895 [Lentzea sp. BCCO 10_0856]|uniref:Uncharacterized protein n=1 Tax=Lentzea miocenica TaxID=3095431 RepID=A0ABU4TDX6_9PSEU|nr:hypothetical protein [Lentzea sp. BCCO 10_0856]MDX8036394.1 hypothetical protein [Lentzea sp. BCCO 10_0856]